MTETVQAPASTRTTRRMILSAAIGNFAEWYDFAVYGVVASILATQFFPNADPTVGLIGAYLIFAVTYLSRPIGGLIAGWLADTFGRRRALSFTILLMCAGTGAIGFLPTYGAIGVAAPVLLALCRLVQGVGTGGEYSSAISFVYEHSEPRRRPILISYLVTTTFLGITSSVLIASLLSTVLGDVAFNAWGWRVLFWISVPLGLTGIYLRSRVDETPEFVQMQERRAESRVKAAPLRSTFRTQGTTMLLYFGVVSAYALLTPVLSSYFITFIQRDGGLSGQQSYYISLVSNLVMIIATLASGPLMMKVGLQKTFIIGGTFIAIVSVPAFAFALHGAAGALFAGAVLSIGKGVVAVAGAVAMSHMFPAAVRVTSGAFAYNMCTIVFGALGPSIGIWLNDATGSNAVFSYYLAGVGALSVVAALIGRQRLRQPFDTAQPAASMR